MVYSNDMSIQKAKFFKPREVADILQLNTLTIYEYIRKGRLPAVRFGKSYRINEKDLESFVKKNIVKAKKK